MLENNFLFGFNHDSEQTKALNCLSELREMKENLQKKELVTSLIEVTKKNGHFKCVSDCISLMYDYRETFGEGTMGWKAIDQLIVKYEKK